ANTCGPVVTGNINIVEPPQVTATISGTTSICDGSSTDITINFTGTSPWTFRYSDGTTISPPIPSFFNSITFSVSPTTTTNYTVVAVSDAICNGVGVGTATVTVNQPADPNRALGTTISPVCIGGTSGV